MRNEDRAMRLKRFIRENPGLKLCELKAAAKKVRDDWWEAVQKNPEEGFPENAPPQSDVTKWALCYLELAGEIRCEGKYPWLERWYANN